MFAIRHKKVPNLWLGHKYHKRGNDYFPIEVELNPSSLKDDTYELYLDEGEFFDDSGYNETTLITLIDKELSGDEEDSQGLQHEYSRNSLLDNLAFIPEDWEVVKLSISVEPVTKEVV